MFPNQISRYEVLGIVIGALAAASIVGAFTLLKVWPSLMQTPLVLSQEDVRAAREVSERHRSELAVPPRGRPIAGQASAPASVPVIDPTVVPERADSAALDRADIESAAKPAPAPQPTAPGGLAAPAPPVAPDLATTPEKPPPSAQAATASPARTAAPPTSTKTSFAADVAPAATAQQPATPANETAPGTSSQRATSPATKALVPAKPAEPGEITPAPVAQVAQPAPVAKETSSSRPETAAPVPETAAGQPLATSAPASSPAPQAMISGPQASGSAARADELRPTGTTGAAAPAAVQQTASENAAPASSPHVVINYQASATGARETAVRLASALRGAGIGQVEINPVGYVASNQVKFFHAPDGQQASAVSRAVTGATDPLGRPLAFLLADLSAEKTAASPGRIEVWFGGW
jgi:hypothetical protein